MTTLIRPTWNQYFGLIALATAARGNCDRAQVGALIVTPDYQIISTGYNGAPRGLPTCQDAGHQMDQGHCIRTTHAETNAIYSAARRGTSTLGCTLYCTHLPCGNCARAIIQAGITRVAYVIPYGLNCKEQTNQEEAGKEKAPTHLGLDRFKQAQIKVEQLDLQGWGLTKPELPEDN